MNVSDILEQRITTLAGLLEVPGGPFGASSGDLGSSLRDRWQREQRLIRRILDESEQNGGVHRTLDLWRERTEAFVRSSEDEDASWRDREGQVWVAEEVLELLADLDDRIAAWRPAETEPEPAAPAPAAADSSSAEPAQADAAKPAKSD